MKFQYFSIVIFILIYTSGITFADINDASSFSGNETVINYDLLAEQEIITNQFANVGALFETINGVSVADSSIGNLFDFASPPNAAFVNVNTGGFLRISFDEPQRRVGTQFETSRGQELILDAFGESGLLETVTVQGDVNGQDLLEGFIGVENVLGIVKVEIRSSTDGFNFGIDDTRFESIPEPTAATILCSFVVLVAFRRDRRAINKR